MLRWLATAAIGLLLVLDMVLPSTPLGRRGREAAARSDVPAAVTRVGDSLPDLSFTDLDGRTLHLHTMRGRPVLLTFERSVDW
jgi:cytochrome oxidase Cu insertion factor (SCO1/SenC/PrrC family)